MFTELNRNNLADFVFKHFAFQVYVSWLKFFSGKQDRQTFMFCSAVHLSVCKFSVFKWQLISLNWTIIWLHFNMFLLFLPLMSDEFACDLPVENLWSISLLKPFCLKHLRMNCGTHWTSWFKIAVALVTKIDIVYKDGCAFWARSIVIFFIFSIVATMILVIHPLNHILFFWYNRHDHHVITRCYSFND